MNRAKPLRRQLKSSGKVKMKVIDGYGEHLHLYKTIKDIEAMGIVDNEV